MAKEIITDLFREEPYQLNKKLSISLPVPPSVNHMYVNTRGGGKRLTKKAENYIRDSRSLINLAVEEQNWTQGKKNTWYYADVIFFMPDRRVRDSHNALKILLDVMQGAVYKNDYYCMPRIQSVEYDPTNPRVEVRISKQCTSQRDKALNLAAAY